MVAVLVPKKTLRTVGDGDVMLFERDIGAVPFVANSKQKYDIRQQPNLIKRLTLHVKVSVNVGGVGSYPLSQDGPFNLIDLIHIRTSQGFTIKKFSALRITLLNNLEFFTRALNTAPATLPQGISIFEFDVIIPFDDHTGVLPERTTLNTMAYNDLTFYCTFTDMLTVYPLWDIENDTATVECSVVSCERPPIDWPDEIIARQRSLDTVVSGPYNVDKFLLPDNTNIKTLMAITRDSEGLRVNTEQENFIVNYDSGSYVLRNLSWGEIRSINKQYYHSEQLDDGVAVIEFDQMHDFRTLFRTKDRNYANAVFEPTATAAGSIELFRRRIATVKGITA